jgi:DNA mismatch endonuclease, patch repair protein
MTTTFGRKRSIGLVVDPETSARLARIRQAKTKPEILVRRELHRLGKRYRVHNRDLPGNPDIANRTQRWAIFVHGCFWHHHTACYRATVPKRNRAFWISKFVANRQRDAKAVRALRGLGYRVILVWECEVYRRETLKHKLNDFEFKGRQIW